MQTLYFFSGFDKDKGITPEIAQSLRECIATTKSIVFICSRPDGHEKSDMYANIFAAQFKNMGVKFEAHHVLDDRKTQAECIELAKSASVIFLLGGSPHLQLEFLKSNGLILVLQQFSGVIMGLSAGAMNMAINAFYSADKDFSISHIYKAVGLADVSIAPHFHIHDEGLINNEILPFSHIIDIYAMCDDSAIMVCGDERRYFGEVYRACQGVMKRIETEQ